MGVSEEAVRSTAGNGGKKKKKGEKVKLREEKIRNENLAGKVCTSVCVCVCVCVSRVRSRMWGFKI